MTFKFNVICLRKLVKSYLASLYFHNQHWRKNLSTVISGNAWILKMYLFFRFSFKRIFYKLVNNNTKGMPLYLHPDNFDNNFSQVTYMIISIDFSWCFCLRKYHYLIRTWLKFLYGDWTRDNVILCFTARSCFIVVDHNWPKRTKNFFLPLSIKECSATVLCW